MPNVPLRTRRCRRRSQIGSQIAEFGAALVVLVAMVFIPLVDLAIVPVRLMMAQEIINVYARKLALCESFRQSCEMLESEPALKTRFIRMGGIEVQSTNLHLRIARAASDGKDVLMVDTPGAIPPDWLPQGGSTPCTYSLVLSVKMSISPAILFSWDKVSVPGLTAAFPVTITSSHEWGNLGLDPATGQFYINE